MVDGVSMYGGYIVMRKAKNPQKGKVLRKKVRKDGVVQRYWYRARTATEKSWAGHEEVRQEGRFEFSGIGKDIYRAIIKAKREYWVPLDQYQELNARDFLENPERFAEKGVWAWFNVQS